MVKNVILSCIDERETCGPQAEGVEERQSCGRWSE